MSIYFFEPNGGIGTTPTFQQVLNAGSTLTQTNIIDCSMGIFTISDATTINFYSTALYNYGNYYINYDEGTNGGLKSELNDTSYKLSMVNSDLFENYLTVDPHNQLYYLGDYLFDSNGTHINIDDGTESILLRSTELFQSRTNNFKIVEHTTGDGVLELNGTGFIAGDVGPITNQYLIIKINGDLYKIQLYLPDPL